MRVDPKSFLAEVTLSVSDKIHLPKDTSAEVASESLLGGKYMSLEPGVEDDTIKTDGSGRITRTQAPMRLDDLIGQLEAIHLRHGNIDEGEVKSRLGIFELVECDPSILRPADLEADDLEVLFDDITEIDLVFY